MELSESDELVGSLDDTLVLSARVGSAQPVPTHNKQTTNSIIKFEECIFDSPHALAS